MRVEILVMPVGYDALVVCFKMAGLVLVCIESSILFIELFELYNV